MLATLFSFALTFGWKASAFAANDDAKAAAREHFQKGLAAYEDQRFAEAADEFETAYKLSPAFKLLYNIGQVDVALGRSVEAVDAFDRYLKQGAGAIPTARKREVEDEIRKQRERIGTVVVRTSPEGAEVRIDGVLVGRTPLARPVSVNAGRHTVEALLSGHAALTREIDIAGKGSHALEMALQATPVPEAASPPVPAPALSAFDRVVMEGPRTPPASVDAAPAVRPAPATELSHKSPESSVNWQRVGGLVLIAGGLATSTIGGIQAYRGWNQQNDASNRLAMATTDAAYDAALPDYNAAKSTNQHGWIVAGIGGAILVGGIVLVATAPEKSNAFQVASWVTTDAGGVVVSGVW